MARWPLLHATQIWVLDRTVTAAWAHSYTHSHVPWIAGDLISIFVCASLCVCVAGKHWQRVGNAVIAKGTSIHFASPSYHSLFLDIVSHIMRFCAGEGCALCGWQGPGGWRECMCTWEGEIVGGGNGPDDANNIILVKWTSGDNDSV